MPIDHILDVALVLCGVALGFGLGRLRIPENLGPRLEYLEGECEDINKTLDDIRGRMDEADKNLDRRFYTASQNRESADARAFAAQRAAEDARADYHNLNKRVTELERQSGKEEEPLWMKLARGVNNDR